MNRILILGRGASGKSTLAAKVGEITGLPVMELDKIFWQPGLEPMPRDVWVSTQTRLIENAVWIMDGDLGPYDAVEPRLSAADTIIVLDFPLLLCAWRAMRRGRERIDFWRWLLTYRRKSLPVLQQAFNKFAPHAKPHFIRNSRQLKQFVTELERRFAR